MNSAIMSKYCPTARVVSTPQLRDYRLVFTRRSIKWQAGVADIIPVKGFSIFGVLYELPEKELAALDKKEGYGKAYDRIKITIKTNKQEYEAFTYTVTIKADREIAPSQEYIDTIIEGAKENELYPRYITFLSFIKEQAKSPDSFRSGCVLQGTQSRMEGKGSAICKVGPDYFKTHSLKKISAICIGNNICMAETFVDPSIPESYCQIDQNIRQAFGIEGNIHFGYDASIDNLSGKGESFLFIRPRYLILPVKKTSWIDSEKNICVLHSNNIRFLGIEEGDYVRIYSVIKTNKSYKTKCHRRRVFSGTATEISKDGTNKTEYPKPFEFYIDSDGREILEIELGSPVYIVADIKKQFLRRSIFYGTTTLLAIIALSPIMQKPLEKLGMQSYSLAITIGLAVLITIMMSIFDIRSKIQY